MANERAAVENQWEEMLEYSLRDFLALSFPDVEASIDWDYPCEFLNAELRATVRDLNPDRSYVDKLVKVCRRGPSPEWVLLYVVIQSQPDSELSARIFRHHSRLANSHAEPVASLVVLADDAPEWRPSRFEYECWGFRVRFAFPICKLLDLSDEDLKRSTNPIAHMLTVNRAAGRRDPGGLVRFSAPNSPD